MEQPMDFLIVKNSYSFVIQRIKQLTKIASISWGIFYGYFTDF